MKAELKWKKDESACILTESRLIRWYESNGTLHHKLLSAGDMYVEETEYITIADLDKLPTE